MITRSKCMAASEAAGEKNWEVERASDTYPPSYHSRSDTRDPILAQSEPPPNPTDATCYLNIIKTSQFLMKICRTYLHSFVL